jgi:hypothetical protein
MLPFSYSIRSSYSLSAAVKVAPILYTLAAVRI